MTKSVPVLVRGVLALCLTLLTLTGCQFHQASQSRAVFVYMCGGDLETNAGRASADLAELMANVPTDAKVVVQTGGAKSWHDQSIDPGQLQRWLVTQDGLELIEAVDRASMASARTFGQFLRFAVSGYRADNMSLVLWGHGNGVSVCADQSYFGDTLTTREISTAFNSLDADVRFDTVVFDACYAATLDLVLAVSDKAQYMVASTSPIPGTGLAYSLIDFSAVGREFAVSVAESFTGSDDKALPQMSVIQLDQAPRFAGFVDGLDLAGLERYATYVSNAYVLADLGDLLPLLPPDEQETLRRLLSKSVVHQVNPETQKAGLSVVVPQV